MLYAKRLVTLFEPFSAYGAAPPRLIIRDLTHRWGSLTDRGNVVLSRDLTQVPRACIDYVITHELCHLVHADHGEGSRSLLNEVMPDHVRRKDRLEQIMLQLRRYATGCFRQRISRHRLQLAASMFSKYLIS